MKFPKLDLLTLLISLFLLSSCKDSSTIGLELDPSETIKGELLDTATVRSSTVPEDPTSTYNMTRYPLGELKSETFGTTAAEIAMAVAAPSASFSFGKNAQIDSAVLVLPYESKAKNDKFYGDTTAVFKFTVKQLSSDLTQQKTFLSNAVYPTTDVLGTSSGTVRPNSPVKVTRIISGAADTVYSAAPQLRVKLSPSMIQNKIMQLDSATLSNDKRFKASFKGLKIEATTTNAKGAIMFFDLATTGASVEIYFRKQNASTTTAVDTVYSSFPVITTASNYVASSVSHQYSSTIADNMAAKTQTQVTYLQGGGLRNKISFPYLSQLKEKVGGTLVISKAELVVDLSNPADTIPFKAPLRLALYRYDLAGQRTQLPDNNPLSNTNQGGDPRASGIDFGGFYNKTKNTYTFVVTNYIQDLLDGKAVDYGTYLAASPAAEFNLFPYPTNLSQTTLGSFNNSNNKRIRLNIYYVKSAQ